MATSGSGAKAQAQAGASGPPQAGGLGSTRELLARYTDASRLQNLHEQDPNAHLVDALPYIEGQVLPHAEEYRVIQKLITDEVQAHIAERKRQRKETDAEEADEEEDNGLDVEIPACASDALLEKLPGFLRHELKRMREGQPMAKVNTARYNAEPPGFGADGNPDAWADASERLKMQIAYSDLRGLNLELLSEFGVRAAIRCKKDNQVVEQMLGEEVKRLKKGSQDVNQRRMVAQVACRNDFQRFGLDLQKYRRDNASIAGGLVRLRTELERLKRLAKRRRLLDGAWEDPTLVDPATKDQSDDEGASFSEKKKPVVLREDDEDDDEKK
eukprot:gene131-218_t